jgi:thiol-disulfide isomerase/thioredoxin
MRLRFALAACAGIALLHGQPPIPRTLADADRIEAQLQSSPDDISARLMLLRYYWAPNNSVPAERVKAALREHAVWMIEHHPEHLSLRENWAAFQASGGRNADPEAFEAADRAWRKHFAEPSVAAAVYANGVSFYKYADRAFARKIAADGMRAFPADAVVSAELGALDALDLLHAKSADTYGRVATFDDTDAANNRAAAARREVDGSKSAAVVGGAGTTLQQQVFALDQARRPEQAAEIQTLAEGYLKRAVELEPKNPRWSAGLSQLYSSRGARATDPKLKMQWFEKSAAVGNDMSRISPLESLAESCVDAGDFAKAAGTARELLALAAKYPDSWAYGNAIHHGNIVLGRVALHAGDTAEAAHRLQVAGGVKGSPQLNSFGPDWKLAAELMAHGEKDAVLAYIDLCRKFWTSGASRLDSWASAIRAGGVPNFSGRPELSKPNIVGLAAPAFKLPKLKGGELSLEQFRGKVVLVDFWATWCGPCREEMPTFEKLHKELGDKDVVILAVDVGEGAEVVSDYIDKGKYTFPVLLAEGTATTAAYSVNAYPTLVSIDREGKVVDYVIGGRDEAALRGIVAKARLGAPEPAATPATTTTTAVSGTRKVLPAPRQLTPPAGAVFEHFPRETTLAWTEVPGASGYVVEWDYKQPDGWYFDLQGLVITLRVIDPVATFRFIGAQPGRWRVMAVDVAGNSGEVTPWREFRYTR